MQEPIFEALGKGMDMETTVPSSGFVSIALAQHCAPEATVHVFGMNWSPQNWEGHDVSCLSSPSNLTATV